MESAISFKSPAEHEFNAAPQRPFTGVGESEMAAIPPEPVYSYAPMSQPDPLGLEIPVISAEYAPASAIPLSIAKLPDWMLKPSSEVPGTLSAPTGIAP